VLMWRGAATANSRSRAAITDFIKKDAGRSPLGTEYGEARHPGSRSHDICAFSSMSLRDAAMAPTLH